MTNADLARTFVSSSGWSEQTARFVDYAGAEARCRIDELLLMMLLGMRERLPGYAALRGVDASAMERGLRSAVELCIDLFIVGRPLSSSETAILEELGAQRAAQAVQLTLSRYTRVWVFCRSRS